MRFLAQPARLLFRALWNRLPPPLQEKLIYLGAPKVTMGVCAVTLDAQERLLLVHHTHSHRGWDLPGGLMRRHEQPTLAVVREVEEELAVRASVGPLLHVDNALSRRHVTIFYRVWIAGEPRHDLETDAHRYVTLDELAQIKGAEAAGWIQKHLLHATAAHGPR
jgi:ADP-ribose pyrophosphatase YjhB (NUDIX family)